MKLGVDGRELATGSRTGIGRYLLEVLRAASKQGWECLVYGDRRTDLHGSLPGITTRPLPERWVQWSDQISLPRQLVKDEITVFLSPYYKCPLWAPCPVVVTIHDLFFIGYLGRRRLCYDAALTGFARLYARRANVIITDSEYSKQSIVDRLGIEPEKICVIPVSVGGEFKPVAAVDAVLTRYGITSPYILSVGNFKPHKNLPALIKAYAQLSAWLRQTHQLVLAGGDRERRFELEQIARDLGILNNVRFPGLIADEDLPALYSGTRLCVLPSLEEGFGLPALEAMACGAPVVASNRAAIPEIVGKAARLFDPGENGSLRAAMTEVLLNRVEQQRLRQRGLQRAQEFTQDRTAGRVLTLLRQVSQPVRVGG